MQSAFSNDLDLLLSGPGLGDGLDFDLLGFAPAGDLLLPPLKEEEKPVLPLALDEPALPPLLPATRAQPRNLPALSFQQAPPQPPPPAATTSAAPTYTAHTDAHSTGHSDMEAEDDKEDEGEAQTGVAGTSKRRRRRTRNAKQQELNRLAQQRYRQRKKQRQQDLQSTVDTLATQLNQLKMLEAEVAGLKKTNEELEAQLGSQTNVLRRVVEQCKQQEATIEHQRTVIEQQAGVMDQQRAALECSAAAQASGALANVDPEVLQAHLMSVLKSVLSEVGVQGVNGSQAAVEDALTRALSTRLSACWRDAQLQGAVSAKGQLLADGITVSCR